MFFAAHSQSSYIGLLHLSDQHVHSFSPCKMDMADTDHR